MIGGLQGLAIAAEFDRAPAAIERIRRSPPDLILLDIQLAEGSGMDVMRAVGSSAQMTIFVITNHADRDSRKRYLESGADAVFDKTAELGELRRALRRWGSKGDEAAT
jgi:DNA-binding response OmpR family regulator